MPDGDDLVSKQMNDDSSESDKKSDSQQAKDHAVQMWDKINKSNSKDRRGDLKSEHGNNPFIKPNTTENEHLEQKPEAVDEPVVLKPTPVVDVPHAPINPFDRQSFASKPLDEVRNVEKEDVIVEEEKSADEMKHASEGTDLSSENVHPERGDVIDVEAADVEPVKVDSVKVDSVDLDLVADLKDEGDEDFKDEFWDVLDQAGITKSTLFWIVALFFAGLAVLLFFIFGGLSFFGSDDENVVDENVDVVVEDDVSNVNLTGKEAVGVLSSYIFGLEFKPFEVVPIGQWGDESGLLSAFLLGQVDILSADKFVEHVSLLRKMDNAFNTDVYALINMAVNRREVLQKHIEDLGILIDEANQSVALLDQEMDSLSLEYAGVIEQRDFEEESFFSNLDLLQGESAYINFETFDGLSQASVDIKAQFNVKSALRDMFIRSLVFLEPRYRDIVTNEDALVQGVRVFDIPGSDIEAIIPLEN